MSSTMEGTLRFIALMLIMILPALAIYLNRARMAAGANRDPNSPKIPCDPAD
jgi:hypothetical protein